MLPTCQHCQTEEAVGKVRYNDHGDHALLCGDCVEACEAHGTLTIPRAS
jgi:hypothetical protein